jgi:hypothetical protein
MITIEPTQPKFILNGQELTIIKEPTIEDLLKQLPKSIEYYINVGDRFPIKQWANLKLMVYGEDDLWFASYRESDYDGDREHISAEGYGLKEALINLKTELTNFPSKFEKFMWVTDKLNEKETSAGLENNSN